MLSRPAIRQVFLSLRQVTRDRAIKYHTWPGHTWSYVLVLITVRFKYRISFHDSE